MAQGILLNLYAPIYYLNEWLFSSEQMGEDGRPLPFFTTEQYISPLPSGDIGDWWGDKNKKEIKLIGLVSSEPFSFETISSPYRIEDINLGPQITQDYKNGIFSVQTFGSLLGVAANEVFFNDTVSGPFFISEINPNQKEYSYKDGIYSVQTFGKYIGIYNNEAFLADDVSASDPINYNQKPELIIPDYKDPDWVIDDTLEYSSLFIGAQSIEVYFNDIDSAPQYIYDINQNQQDPKNYKDGIYSIQTFGKLSFLYSGEQYNFGYNVSGDSTDKNQTSKDYLDGIYSTQTFGKYIGIYNNEAFSVDDMSASDPINYNQKPELIIPNYKDPDWIIEDGQNKTIELLLGLKSNEIFSNDSRSYVSNIDEINNSQKPLKDYFDGIYSVQTFGRLTNVFSQDVFNCDYDSVDINANENQTSKDYINGIYSIQTFGKYIGIYNNDAFFNETNSGNEEINYNQKPELIIPNYKDPDWIIEDSQNKIIELLLGLKSNEIFSNDSRSYVSNIDEINNSQKPLKDYKDGIYSIQTFGKLSFLYPGEQYNFGYNVSGDSTDENQIFKDYINGIYSIQTFGKYIGINNNEAFLADDISASDPINYNQKPELIIPNYKDPDWIIEDGQNKTMQLLLGLRNNEIFSNDSRSYVSNIDEINNSQKPLKDYRDGIYSVQTFGKLSFLYSGEQYNFGYNVSGDSTDKNQISKNYKNGIYSIQTFGKYIDINNNEAFLSDGVSASDPINYNQKPELIVPNYKDPDWIIENSQIKTIKLIGAQLNDLFSMEMDSAPMFIDEINNNQKSLINYKNGIYSIQTFGKLSFLYSNDNFIFNFNVSEDLVNKNQIQKNYKNGIYATQTFGRYNCIISNQYSIFNDFSENEVIDYNQKPEFIISNYKDTEWIVENQSIYLSLLNILEMNEVFSNDSYSININNDNNKIIQHINGIFSIQCFGYLIDAVCGELYSI